LQIFRSCRFKGSTSFGRKTFGRQTFRRHNESRLVDQSNVDQITESLLCTSNIMSAKLLSAKCLSAKCFWTKNRGAIKSQTDGGHFRNNLIGVETGFNEIKHYYSSPTLRTMSCSVCLWSNNCQWGRSLPG